MSSKQEREETVRKAEEARRALNWVQGRLDVLEYLILFFSLVLALLGGALAAWILGSVVSWPFRLTWAVASLVLFVLPGGFVYLRELRRRGAPSAPDSDTNPKEPYG